jgi:hypothetical protein
MRVFIILALLISFGASAYASAAMASMQGHNCLQEKVENDSTPNSNDPCDKSDAHDHKQCDDCLNCCSHSQIVIPSFSYPYDLLFVNNSQFIIKAEYLPSTDPQGLKRPPRL